MSIEERRIVHDDEGYAGIQKDEDKLLVFEGSLTKKSLKSSKEQDMNPFQRR